MRQSVRCCFGREPRDKTLLLPVRWCLWAPAEMGPTACAITRHAAPARLLGSATRLPCLTWLRALWLRTSHGTCQRARRHIKGVMEMPDPDAARLIRSIRDEK